MPSHVPKHPIGGEREFNPWATCSRVRQRRSGVRCLPVFRSIVITGASALALWLAGCSNLPLREDVVAQANQQGEIAFNVVKIDEAVLDVLAARPRPAFRESF